MGKTEWGIYQQGSDQLLEIMELGERLSLAISCTVHLYGKNLFECECGVIFPVYFLKGHSREEIEDFHTRERELALA